MSAVLQTMTPAQRAHRRGVTFFRWLRRIHLYVGLWGAALGLLFGATGLLMNHRALLKIPVEKAVQKSAQLKLPDGGFADIGAMAGWLQSELQFQGLQGRIRAEPPRTLAWGDRSVEQPERWSFNWQSPHKAVSAEYFVGNCTVKVEMQDMTPLGTLMRLHTATGVSAFWVLLADTIAGGMVLLSVTGLLLWTRLHAMKLVTAAVACGALFGAAWFLWSSA
jgi:hypothetical protein